MIEFFHNIPQNFAQNFSAIQLNSRNISILIFAVWLKSLIVQDISKRTVSAFKIVFIDPALIWRRACGCNFSQSKLNTKTR